MDFFYFKQRRIAPFEKQFYRGTEKTTKWAVAPARCIAAPSVFPNPDLGKLGLFIASISPNIHDNKMPPLAQHQAKFVVAIGKT